MSGANFAVLSFGAIMFFFGFGNLVAYIIPGANINPGWSDVLAKMFGWVASLCGMLIIYLTAPGAKPSGGPSR